MPDPKPCAKYKTRIDARLKECPECGYNPNKRTVGACIAIVMVGIMLTYVSPLGGSAVAGIGLVLLVVTYFQDLFPAEGQ